MKVYPLGRAKSKSPVPAVPAEVYLQSYLNLEQFPIRWEYTLFTLVVPKVGFDVVAVTREVKLVPVSVSELG